MTAAPRTPRVAALLAAVLLGGCGKEEANDRPEPASAPAAARPEPAAPAADPAPPPAAPIPGGYAAGLRARLLRGEADAVRLASPPGLLAAVGGIRRALARAEPGQRADALAAVAALAEIAETRTGFLTVTEAVRQGDTPGVQVPGWAPAVLRAVAAGPAATADPAEITDEALLDGTVAALLADPAFRGGLEMWAVSEDVPAVPPAASGGEDGGEEVTGLVELAGPGGAGSPIPVVASGGRWVPVIVEATLPIWAAKADTAGGTGAAAVLAAAKPHLEAAAAATTQAGFDDAVRAATAAALAVADGPPAPVKEEEEVTLLLTRPLTARQVADLLPVLEAAADDPNRAASKAAPRSGGPGWRVTVGPIADPAAWLARLPVLVGAETDGRTVTVAYQPPSAEPAPTE